MSAQPHGRADLLRDLQAGENQCTARSKRTGQRCKRPSSLGSNVCRAHGSAAPQTRAKAQRRLAQASDVLVQRLLSLALDGDTPDNVALSAIIAALDRAGISVKTAATVEVTVRPFERVFDAITAGPRDPEQPALEAPNDEDRLDAEAIDVEIVDPEADPSLGLDAEDAEIVDAGYTDAEDTQAQPLGTTTTTTPPGGRSPLSGQLSPETNALGMSTPPTRTG
jgi:hypothetical protein